MGQPEAFISRHLIDIVILYLQIVSTTDHDDLGS